MLLADRQKKLKVFLATYSYKDNVDSSYLCGPSLDLFNYLKTRVKGIIYLEQPDPLSSDLTPQATIYTDGFLKKKERFPMFWFPLKRGQRRVEGALFAYILFKIRDIFSIVYFFIKIKEKFDFYIGVESPNALMGIFLRLLGRVKYVVYDVVDYSPQRFKNKILNWVFHVLDKFCVYNSDFVWNQTSLVAEAREKRGILKEKSAPQLVKSTGVEAAKIRQLNKEQINRYQIVYVGGLFEREGALLLLKALPLIVKEVPRVNLLVIGSGELDVEFKSQLKEQKLEKNCQMLGIVPEAERVESMLLESAIALAPYKDDPFSVKFYNDVSKVKVYASCGLPIVITRVPQVAQKIDKVAAGISVNYDKNDFAQAVIRLLKDDEFFMKTRKNTIDFIKKYTWEAIFDNLFKEMLNIIDEKNK